MSAIKKYVIIVAGGAGSRMATNIPKQFIELCGLPVLMHTISAFKRAFSDIEIILVLPQTQIQYWKNLCLKYNFNDTLQICEGGETRFESVKNGLSVLEGEGLVGIHDGVRPLVSEETIRRCFNDAAIYGNAVPVIDVIESVRYIEGSKNLVVDRSKLRIIQTPQVFSLRSIKLAFEQDYNESFTDDASVMEYHGGIIHLTEGNRENIKITHQHDITVGECLLNKLSQNGHENFNNLD